MLLMDLVVFSWINLLFSDKFRAFDRSLLDSQLLAKSQILQDQIASADKQATK